MSKIKIVSCDDDGEVYFVVGEVTKLGALRAIKKFAKYECGLDEEAMPRLEDLVYTNFWHTDGDGESSYGEDWYWWGKPEDDLKPTPAGGGWIYKLIDRKDL